ncbi:MAG: SOS response-associated peptidase [Clostridiales bacterium]
MCGRYLYYYDKDDEEIQKIVKQIDKNKSKTVSGEIYPSNMATVIVRSVLTSLKWGYLLSKSNLIINARSETLLQKPLFKNSYLDGKRCLIPAQIFFEWKKENTKKIKYEIFSNYKKTFFMAGIYNSFTDKEENKVFSYVILTTDSNKYIEKIHNRMPVIINSREDQFLWMNKSTQLKDLNNIIKKSSNIELNFRQNQKIN